MVNIQTDILWPIIPLAQQEELWDKIEDACKSASLMEWCYYCLSSVTDYHYYFQLSADQVSAALKYIEIYRGRM